jgi:hypothetical protein
MRQVLTGIFMRNPCDRGTESGVHFSLAIGPLLEHSSLHARSVIILCTFIPFFAFRELGGFWVRTSFEPCFSKKGRRNPINRAVLKRDCAPLDISTLHEPDTQLCAYNMTIHKRRYQATSALLSSIYRNNALAYAYTQGA